MDSLKPCLTNMLCFLEEITKWIDVGSPVDIIYLDFQKAFDKVPHQRLLLKLKAHGIGDSITDWIEQWLTDRRQRVVVDGEVSNWKSVLSGVPQGSVLGPILFLIYINDLDDSITSNVLKFADDTKLFRKVNTDGDKQHLQNDLLLKWSEKWLMLFLCHILLLLLLMFQSLCHILQGKKVNYTSLYYYYKMPYALNIQRRATKMIPELRDLSY